MPDPSRQETRSKGAAEKNVIRWTTGCSFATLIAAGLTTTFFSCQSRPLPPPVTVPEALRLTLPSEIAQIITQLDSVQKKLESIDQSRKELVSSYGLIIKSSTGLSTMYSRASNHLLQLWSECGEFKKELTTKQSITPEYAAKASAWATLFDAALSKVLELIKHLKENNGKWLSGWVAPDGFDYIKPINSDE